MIAGRGKIQFELIPNQQKLRKALHFAERKSLLVKISIMSLEIPFNSLTNKRPEYLTILWK